MMYGRQNEAVLSRWQCDNVHTASSEEMCQQLRPIENAPKTGALRGGGMHAGKTRQCATSELNQWELIYHYGWWM